MERFEKVEIDLSSSAELRMRLDSFTRRAANLTEFMKSQKWGIQSIHVDRSNQDQPWVHGTLPNELVLEGLYRRFRFFILNDEDSNYLRFLRLLSASSKNELHHRFLRLERKEFFQSHSLEFAFITANLKYHPEEVIDFWFNAYYFHDQEPERKKLATFESIVSAEGAKVLLWESVWNSALKVRNMAWLVREATPKNPFVYVPLFCAV
jgi:hypothetical protein